LREEGAKFVQAVWQEGAPQPPHGAGDDAELAEESAEAEAADEARGLGSRLSALIGRDFGDGADDGEVRREPPLENAPELRIEPSDRAIHEAAPPPAVEASVSSPALRSTRAAGRLAGDDLSKLQAALQELAACRKLLDAAAAPE